MEKEIEQKENEIHKCEREITETERDEALPTNKKRQRRRNEDGVLETPWPRDYVHERRVLNNKVNNGKEYCKTRVGKIRGIQSQHDFFQDLVERMADVQPQDCPVCMEQKGEGSKLSVLSCGHFTCPGCVAELLLHQRICPMCRAPLSQKAGGVMTVTIRKLDEEAPDDAELDNSANIAKYGSKVFAFIKFAQETMQEDPDNKIILFIQYTTFVTGYSNIID
jgi:hypothetical protein